MNQISRVLDADALLDPIDTLLADIAIRVQLSATDHGKAVSRYQTINDYVDRDGSLLRGHVSLFYPQGSMAIDATIASRLRTDEFDIDIVAELALPPNTPPRLALDVLYESIRGERGSRYYGTAERRTRCVTVHYSDDMHLDVTPVVLDSSRQAKTSILFHHRPEDGGDHGHWLWANPWGFAEWFRQQTPIDHAFAQAFSRRASLTGSRVVADTACEPVRVRKEAHEKSKAVIVLQLLKRWRNVQYDSRRDLRRPPSVMMSKLVADAANQTETLFQELVLQATRMRQVIGDAHDRGQKVRITNPCCPDDLLTDRWPESQREQQLFLNDLDKLIRQLALLPESDLAGMRKILTELFGENPTGAAFDSYNRQLGEGIASGRSMHFAGSGRVLTAGMAVPRGAVATRQHTFFGHPRE